MATFQLQGVAGQEYNKLSEAEKAQVQATGNAALQQYLSNFSNQTPQILSSGQNQGQEAAQRQAEAIFTARSQAQAESNTQLATNMNNFIAANPNASSLPTNIDPTGQYAVVNGVLTQKSAIAAKTKEEADYAAGLTDRVRVGSGWAYVPKGSAAANLIQGIQSGQVSATNPQQQFQASLQGNTVGQPGVTAVAPSAPPAQPTGAQPVVQPAQQTQFGQSSYTGPSIVDYLSSKGQNTSFSSRRQLAAQFGIQNYTGTPEQNTQLLNTLRNQGQQQAGTIPSPGGAIVPPPGAGAPPVPGAVPTPGTPTTPGVQSATQYQNLLSMTGNLQTGARGTEVQQLQQFLQSQGFNVGTIDGIFGPKTQQALRQFQQSEGIAADAIVGPITRSKIQSKLNASQVENLDQGETQGEAPLSEAETDYSNYLQQQSYDDVFTSLSNQAGLPDIKNRLTEFQAKLDQVRQNFVNKQEGINNNPWTSESQRIRKLKSAEASFKQEEANALESFNQVQKIYDNAVKEIEFRAKLQVEQQNKDREFYFKAKEAAQKEKARQEQLSKINTQVVRIGNRQVLINRQTGETIRDIGPAPSGAGGGGASTQEIQEMDTQIYDLMGGLSPEQLDQLIDLGLF